MFRIALFILVWLCTPLVLAGGLPATPDLESEAGKIAGQFVSRLKPQLKAAMQSGGPSSAIGICADVAPTIAWQLSKETGWFVRRVSLKARNTSTAIPDTWERQQLQAFDAAVAKGQPPGNGSAWVNGEFRYLKPQLVEGLCLACHGTNLAPEVSGALALYYRDDQATGYELGQVRGAISLRWLPESGSEM